MREGQSQHDIWNGTGGQAWVETQHLLDEIFKPLERLLVDAISNVIPSRLLDVGCGTGATTIAAADRIGDRGQCVGIDISRAMLEAARSRANHAAVDVRLVCADAQSHPFAPGDFDMIISRFGVMFFDQPVLAFGNLYRAARPGAQLCCIVWRGPQDNPFMTTAEKAAEHLLPGVSGRVPGAPGQFGLADPARVQQILRSGGWTDVSISPVDANCEFDAAQLDLYFSRVGPVGRALQQGNATTRSRVMQAVRPAFSPYIEGNTVRFTAACWMLRAGKPNSA